MVVKERSSDTTKRKTILKRLQPKHLKSGSYLLAPGIVMVYFEYRPQSKVKSGSKLPGSAILLYEGDRLVGGSGYVEWEVAPYARPDHKTCRLYYDNKGYDIWLEDSFVNQGHGYELLSQVIGQCSFEGFTRFFVIAPFEEKRSFYEESFRRLMTEGIIKSFSATQDFRKIKRSLDYEVIL